MKYILDIAKWRCGGISGGALGITPKDSKTAMGRGPTGLLNEDGYACCLGQFASQCGVSAKQLLNNSYPADVDFTNSDGEAEDYDWAFVYHGQDTDLARRCTSINDDRHSTVKYKVRQLKRELKLAGHSLEVVNKHLIPK